MFNFIKKVSSQVLANTLVVSADQFIRSHIAQRVKAKYAAKRAQQDHEQHTPRR